MLTTHAHKIILTNKNKNRIRFCKPNNANLIDFSSNDYLGLRRHPKVIQALIDGAQYYGLGSGASAVVSGYHNSHEELENKFADFLQRDRAVIFNCGYMANIGVMTTFANRQSKIMVDKQCHASLLDGVKLSRADYQRFPHNDLTMLKSMLLQHQQPSLIVTEGIFSMEGSITAVDEMVDLAHSHQSDVVLDDAHAIGVLGATGAGSCEYFNLSQNDVACVVAPLGKAFASMGAIVAGKHEMIEAIIQTAQSYRYTTALPPAVAHATVTALDLVKHESWRREKLYELNQYFNAQAKLYGLPLMTNSITPIKTILIGDNQKTVNMQNYLRNQHYLVACIRPPTVAEGSARLRISLNSNHDEHSINQLLQYIEKSYANNQFTA